MRYETLVQLLQRDHAVRTELLSKLRTNTLPVRHQHLSQTEMVRQIERVLEFPSTAKILPTEVFALVAHTGRPSVIVQQGTFGASTLEAWTDKLNAARPV